MPKLREARRVALSVALLCLAQRVPCRTLHGSPRCPFPRAPRRARWRVLHPARVEGRTPALLVVAGELEVVALPSHPALNVTDATPRIQPGAKGVHGAIVGGQRESGEAEGCPEELAALVEHASVHQIFHHGFALFRLRTNSKAKSFWCSY